MSPTDSPTTLLALPEEHRVAFKEPFGPVYEDPAAILAGTDGRIVTVGDVVTYHFERHGYRPEVAVVDGLTQRDAVTPEIRSTIAERPNRVSIQNPAGTLTVDLVETLVEAMTATDPVTVDVDGEEDLATVPAVLAARPPTTVVYGQPDAGMVAIEVEPDRKAQFRELIDLLEGDHDRFFARLE